MQLRYFSSTKQLYDEVATRIMERQQQGATVFGLATGGTMEPLYEQLRHRAVDFSASISFNLDEYIGAPPSQTYAAYMEKHLFRDKPFQQSYIPNGDATNPEAEAKRYDELLAKHRIDVQLLGIGVNGHIGFNEPSTPFTSRTHVVTLTASTRHANARFFASLDEVPTHAITVGIETIMQAKEVLVIVTGEHKRQALSQLLYSDVTEQVPSTILQQHPNVHIFTNIKL